MKCETCFLVLGSNLGDRRVNLFSALEKLKIISIHKPKVSGFYLSEPWGFSSDKMFYNLAVKIQTNLSPRELLSYVLEVEKELGRTREISEIYLPRIIDIDIIFYGEKIVNEKDLIIPHPRVHLRKFALLPLCEIEENFKHPIFNKSLKNLLSELNDPLEVKIIAFND